jgi:hypothetical protein
MVTDSVMFRDEISAEEEGTIPILEEEGTVPRNVEEELTIPTPDFSGRGGNHRGSTHYVHTPPWSQL